MGNISKIGGFSFNNFSVDNTNDMFLLEVEKNAVMVTTEENSIIVKVGIYGTTREEFRRKQRLVIQTLFNKEGFLVFYDEKDLYYMAIVKKAIEVEEGCPFNILTITFDLLKPFLYRDAQPINLVIGENTVINEGNITSYPIIKLSGTGSITINGIYIEVYGEPVFIDSERKIIYRVDSEGNKKNHMEYVFGDTFTLLKAGVNYVYMAGVETVTAEMIYKHTYIG